jgi:hypothetical protein
MAKEKTLEERQVVALEKIATILDSFTLWFEDVDKEEWSNRIQYYLSEFHNKFIEEKNGK